MNKIVSISLILGALSIGLILGGLPIAVADAPGAGALSEYVPKCERVSGGGEAAIAEALPSWMLEQKAAGASDFVMILSGRYWCAY